MQTHPIYTQADRRRLALGAFCRWWRWNLRRIGRALLIWPAVLIAATWFWTLVIWWTFGILPAAGRLLLAAWQSGQ